MRAIAEKCAATATMLFPEPVGVLKMTLEPETTSMMASSCAGYSVRPRSSVHALKASNNASGSLRSAAAGRWSSRLGNSAPAVTR